MKKVFSVLVTLALTMSVVFWVTPSKSLAGPAPALTDLQIIGITSDGNNFVWEDIHPYQMAAKKPLNGSEVRIAVYYKGTESYGGSRIYSDGVDITSQTSKAANDDLLSGADRIVYGYIKYYKIPIELLSSGGITVSAKNYYPPNKVFNDRLSFTINNGEVN
ncbi:DUF4879 domain-containing protein [Bacillus sp. REN10]|uniref:DUF4879 domain-containing protein n=1 Tax=Bacillus sp. REN10 TaxID=2782541 RepID=UPI00193B51B6|nr:DUF4879 domain-containing protein [Bacillus sp. REN10]